MTASSTTERPGAALHDLNLVEWPFWVPSSPTSIVAALDLAGVGPGELVADLGCGDGRVLEAAVMRGARAIGYETNPQLARLASERLEPFGAAAAVRNEDFRHAPIDADVVFCYLSPASLFRMRDRFSSLHQGTRVVSRTYRIEGWRTTERTDDCNLYRLPARHLPAPDHVGFRSSRVVVQCAPGATALFVVAAALEPGGAHLEVTPRLTSFARIYLGAGAVSELALMPIDVVVAAPPEGRTVSGRLSVQGHVLEISVVGRSGAPPVARLDDSSDDNPTPRVGEQSDPTIPSTIGS